MEPENDGFKRGLHFPLIFCWTMLNFRVVMNFDFQVSLQAATCIQIRKSNMWHAWPQTMPSQGKVLFWFSIQVYHYIYLPQATVTVEPPLFCCAASMAITMELGYYAAMGSFRAVVEAKGLSLKPDMRAQRDRIIRAYSLESLASGLPAHMVLSKAYFFHQVRLHVRSLPNEEQWLGCSLDRIVAPVACATKS